MAAPVPIRASDMVAPSIWDLANLGGTAVGNSSIRRGRGGGGAGGGAGGRPSTEPGSSLNACDVAASSSSSGPMTSTSMPANVLDGEGCGTAAAMMAANSTLVSTQQHLQQRMQGCGNEAPGWPTVAMVSAGYSVSGDGRDRGGSNGRTWTDSAGHSVAYGNGNGTGNGTGNGEGISGQGQHLSSRSIGSGSSSSCSYYACQYAEAAAKRQRTDNSTPTLMAMAGVDKPAGQAYASLFGGGTSVTSGNEFDGVLANGMSHTRGETGTTGGVCLDGFDCYGLGDNGGGFGDDCVGGVDVGSAWIDAVFDGESTSASSPNPLYDK